MDGTHPAAYKRLDEGLVQLANAKNGYKGKKQW